ncbi:MAG: pantetheine-phosphate adenylyltransferase [Kiritimatiellae bacterium]|jgi:pantetheine-phosphate adenylyltransferase|nr:pantetheine-phosphate adenylyltransferase [Kiritimatiellia bacterium]MDD4341389.1 pantetheine-phosphate adenylyltransferase [Kiritimatiellia bacterium]MDY0148731.1 pantetheine-phosphate adenylyltransferase [Kiritimatiellia bacterium]
MKGAIYAGTFDPVTYGHIDMAERAALIFDQLIVAVAEDPDKTLLFGVQDRVALAQACLAHLDNIEVVSFSGLLVDWARARDTHTLIRGLRAFSDFEYEFQMALTNRKLAPDIETMFLMPNEEFSYISSSMVREIAALGGEVEKFVPAGVAAALRQKLSREQAG